MGVLLASCSPGSGRDAATEDIVFPSMDSMLRGDGPSMLPEGAVALPDGAVVLADGALLPDTGIVAPDAGRMDGDAGSSDVADVVNLAEDPSFMGLDAAVPEAAVSGPCTVVSTSAFGNETRALPRVVTTFGEGVGFSGAATVQRSGTDNVWLHRVDLAGTITASYDLSGATSGTDFSGGTAATDGMGYLAAWSNASVGAGDIFVRRASTGGVPSGSAVNLSNDAEASTEPQLASSSTGFVVAWRSGTGASSTVRTAWVDPGLGLHAGTTLSATTGVVAWRLAGSRDSNGFAIVYLLGAAGSRQLQAQRIDAMGAAQGGALTVATGDLDDRIDATARATPGAMGIPVPALAVAWGEPRSAPQLRMRQLDLATPGGPLDHAALTVDSSVGTGPGIAPDGTGYALSWRVQAGPSVALSRLRADFTVRDRSIVAGAGTGDGVRVATTASRPGLYGLGWADVLGAGTVLRILLASCPP